MNKNPKMNYDEDEIDLLELWYLFLEKIKSIVLVTLVFALVAAGITKFVIKPEYQATAKLYIVSSSSGSVVNLSDLQLGTNLTNDYKELVLTRPMMESTIKNLNLPYTVKELKGMISIVNPSSTRLLNITVTTHDPKESASIANEIARLAQTWLPETMESAAPHIAEDAVAPATKSGPSTTKNTLIGAMAGFVLIYGYYVVMFLVDDTIRTTEDFEKYFDIMPLASVPQDDSIDYGEHDSATAPIRAKKKKSSIAKRVISKQKGGKK